MVTFKDGSTALATVNLAAGSASYSTSTLAVGHHALSASYGGDAHNVASASQTTVERVQALATTTLSASAVGILPGDSVTLTATVTGASPTGTITFFADDGTVVAFAKDEPCITHIENTSICGGVKLASGLASTTLGPLPNLGRWVISAVYNGDENNSTSRSAALTVTVSDLPPPPPPTPTSENGGGGALSLPELCAALTLILLRVAIGSCFDRSP